MAVGGVLDLSTCGSLATMLEWTLEQDSRETVLDLTGLDGIDHDGVHTILLAYLRSADQRDEFVIIPGRESVQRVIDRIHGPFRYTTRASLSMCAASDRRPWSAPGQPRRRSSRPIAGGQRCARRVRGWCQDEH